jgi:hypothetical protein
VIDYEFYETPDPLTAWLLDEHHIIGDCREPCVGDGAIIRAASTARGFERRSWTTNDLDTRWPADSHMDASDRAAWVGVDPDWTVTNTPFSCWQEIAEQAITASKVGVAMYLRLSAHEPKKGKARGWWQRFPPSAVYVCPRFAHQRSKKTGEWSTDSVTCAWTVWDRRMAGHGQILRYAPASVIEALDAYTPGYRERMDALMAARAA